MALVLHTDLVARATLSASAWEPLLAPSQLKSMDLGLPWRTPAGTDAAWLVADLQGQAAVGCTALLRPEVDDGATWRIRLSTADPTGEAGDAYDSGELDDAFDPRFLHFVHWWPNATGRYLRIDIDRPGADQIGAGAWLAGPCWTTSCAHDRGYAWGREQQRSVERSRSGARWTTLGGSWRTLSCMFGHLTLAEFRDELPAVSARIEADLPVVLGLVPGSDNQGRDSIVGHVDSAIAYPEASHQRFSWSPRVTEIV